MMAIRTVTNFEVLLTFNRENRGLYKRESWRRNNTKIYL